MADPATPRPQGSKCRTITCTTQVDEKRLYCAFCWGFLPQSYKDELVAHFDPSFRLTYQSQAFMQARIKADAYLNQTLKLVKSQADQKKKTG